MLRRSRCVQIFYILLLLKSEGGVACKTRFSRVLQWKYILYIAQTINLLFAHTLLGKIWGENTPTYVYQ